MKSGKRPSFILSNALKTITSGCSGIYFGGVDVGLGEPAYRVCPLDVPMAGIEFNYDQFTTSTGVQV